MADTSKPDAAITDSKTLNSYHKGHRERMRAKVSADSTSILSDAEVLEMFLYGINSRADTKPVVKACWRSLRISAILLQQIKQNYAL